MGCMTQAPLNPHLQKILHGSPRISKKNKPMVSRKPQPSPADRSFTCPLCQKGNSPLCTNYTPFSIQTSGASVKASAYTYRYPFPRLLLTVPLGERPFKCPKVADCSKRFSRRDELIRHLRNQHHGI